MCRRRSILCLVPAVLALSAGGGLVVASAQAAGTLVIDGRGFGHGVGMSQYGAYGYAQRGVGYQDILRHYYTGTSISRLSSAPEVGVLLATSRRTVTVTQADSVGGVAIDPGRAYRISTTKTGSVVIRDDKGKRVAKAPGAVRVTADGGRAAAKLLGRSGDGMTDAEYRGALAVRPEGVNNLSVVNAVGLEDYVRGVVGAESPSNWPTHALRAQAVAARTYALSTDAGSATDGYTQYPDTRSQVYRGIAAETATTDAAVAATAREIVTYGGRPIVAYFFSTSGGRTENVEHGFPGAAPQPYLVSVKDPYDSASPRHSWRVRLTLKEAEAKLGPLVKGSLRRIQVLQRGVSPRVVRARIVGSRGTTDVDGATLRRRFGLDDTWARFSIVTTEARRRVVRRAVAAAAAVTRPAVAADAVTPVLSILGLESLVAPTEFDSWASFDAAVTQQTPQPTTGTEELVAPATAPARSKRVRVRTLRGRVTGRGERVTFRVQRGLGDGRWRTVTTVRTSSRGFYKVRVPKPGVYRIRTRGLTGPNVRVK